MEGADAFAMRLEFEELVAVEQARRPRTPLAMPRSAVAGGAGLHRAQVATTTLPHSSNGMPCWAQKSFMEAHPATQLRALREPVR